jgi:hypothetical protein
MVTYETLVNMKKQNLLSKLKLQKTTIASLKTMKSIKGGTLLDTDTSPLPLSSPCITLTDCPTQNNQYTCPTTNSDTDQCPRPTHGGTEATDRCTGNNTKMNCMLTRDCI